MKKQEVSDSIIVELYITEPEDVELIKEIFKNVPNVGTLLSVTKDNSSNGCYNVQAMFESPTLLYLLGRYVGVDRKRLFDKDF
jgi:hypothetical protein